MYQKLQYRRQFLLAKAPITPLADWNCLRIDQFYLYSHPDLELTVKEESSRLVILLGYIFDYVDPAKNNEDIISDIISRIRGFDDLITAIKSYAGRYALIYRDKNNFTIQHDALGVREIYYCTQLNKVVCGSQPNLLDTFSEPKLGVTQDQSILHFYEYEMKPVRLGRLWVGDETYYHSVKHLMPNHYLDIRSLTAKRYWPNKRLEKMDLLTAVKLSCNFLRGVLKAVMSRYDVMMAVTAGFDSRSLLAASREVRDRIYYFINKEPPLSDRSPDIRVPRDMFNKLNIPFHVHDVTGPVDEEIRKVYLNNTFWSSDRALPTIYNVYFKNHQEKMNLLGLGELGRVYYGEAPNDIDGYFLARNLKYKSSKYATVQCEKWLREARGIAETFNIDIMKFFLWESLIANWGSLGNSESDIAIEEFDPYSSHYILEIMLSFDQNQGDIFKGMFKEMWPELLNFPLNPPDTMSDWIKHWLQQMGLFTPLKRQIYRFDRWKYRRLMSASHRGT